MNIPANGKELKKQLNILGNKAAKKALRTTAKLASGSKAPYLNRYDNTGFLEGSGYFLTAPAEDSGWRVGFAKDSIFPADTTGDTYIGGAFALRSKKATGNLNDQFIRAIALDDLSGRGLHVFAVIDGIGLSLRDVRVIRTRLKDLTEEKNIESIQICATHCYSAVDTLGLSGDIKTAFKKGKAEKNDDRADRSVTGYNTDYMDYLIETTAETIEAAVADISPGSLDFAFTDVGSFLQDTLPKGVGIRPVTLLRFTPESPDKQKLLTVFMANRPQNYDAGSHTVSADYPYYLCKTLEDAGYAAAYFQGADDTVSASTAWLEKAGTSRYHTVQKYGEALAEAILKTDESAFSPVEPLLNVMIKETFIPVDNAALEFFGSMKMFNSPLTRVTNGEDGKDFEYYLPTEIGYAEIGTLLKFALIPGTLNAAIAFGEGTEAFPYPPMEKAVYGNLTVIGHCNDSIGRISPAAPEDDIFSVRDYDASATPGSRTAVNIAGAFVRAVEAADKIRIK